jgi:peptidyl-prolyl cis-trans isomerase SurA
VSRAGVGGVATLAASLLLASLGHAAPATPAPAVTSAHAVVPAPVGAVAVLDRIVATVDGLPIWQSAVDEVLVPLRASSPEASLATLTPQAVDALIDEAIITAAAARRHVEASAEDLQKAWQAVADQNRLSAEQFVEALAGAGYTPEVYRERLAHQLRTTRLVQIELASRISISADELAAAYATLKASDPKLPPLPQVKDAVEAKLRADKLEAATAGWLAALRAEARIERRP